MAKSNRDVILKVRLTFEEFAKLKEQSKRTGRTMSDIFRAAWKKMKIVELPSADFTETVIQLRRLGNNLNQLTRAANEGNVLVPQIKNALGEISNIGRKLGKILSGGDNQWQ